MMEGHTIFDVPPEDYYWSDAGYRNAGKDPEEAPPAQAPLRFFKFIKLKFIKFYKCIV